jgi:hypothetical protein
MIEFKPSRTYGLATASPETRKRVWAAATAARAKAFAMYRAEQAKLKAEAKAAKTVEK